MKTKLSSQIKTLILLFIIGLAISGLTAFPLQWELSLMEEIAGEIPGKQSGLYDWILKVKTGLDETYEKYPFIAYGTDWLAFAHLLFALLFIGPLLNPVKNIWVIEFGLLACIAIFPLAFIAGPIRGIPFFWRLIDCSFGIIGGILLWICYSKIKSLIKITEYDA